MVLGTGSTSYSVTNNFIAANLSAGNGGGISHVGLSELGVIDANTVVFNESFMQGIGHQRRRTLRRGIAGGGGWRDAGERRRWTSRTT